MNAYSAYKALIIGVGKYADPQYDLSYARSDAEAMAELLSNEFDFNQVWTLYDDDATRQQITRYFEQDLQQTDEDDGILIFFAGHGFTVRDPFGEDLGFLMPHDGDQKRPNANLSMITIREYYLRMIPAKHVFLIVDACYSGLALRDVASVEHPKSIDHDVLSELTRKDRKIRQVLAAGTKEQRVLDGGLFGHSIFTGRLIEALREADPYITADHVGVHVRERVARDSMDRKHRQTPQFGVLYGGGGAFVFQKRRVDTALVPPDVSEDLVIAQSHIQAGRYKEAKHSATEGLKKDPLSYELRKLLRESEEAIVKAAEHHEQERQEKTARYVSTLIKNAKSFEADGDIEAAVACLKQAVEYTQSTEAVIQLKRLKAKTEHPDMDTAAKLKSIFAEAEALEKSAAGTALVLYEEALKAYPNNRRAIDGIERCQELEVVQSTFEKTKIAASLSKRRLSELQTSLELLKQEVAEYQSLAMDSEAQKVEKEITLREERLRKIETAMKFYSRALRIIKKAETISSVVTSIQRSRTTYQAVRELVLKQTDYDQDVLVVLVPEVIDAKTKIDNWLAEVEENVRTFRKAKSGEDELVRKEQELVDQKHKQLPWLIRLVTMPRILKRRTINPPAIPRLPQLSMEVFGSMLLDYIPDVTSNGTDLTLIKETVSYSDKIERTKQNESNVSTKRNIYEEIKHSSSQSSKESFTKFASNETGFNATKISWLLNDPALAIASLVLKGDTIKVPGLGFFSLSESGKMVCRIDPDNRATSRSLRATLRSFSMLSNEVDDCLRIWSLIYPYAMKEPVGFTIRKFGRFNQGKLGKLIFTASPSTKLGS